MVIERLCERCRAPIPADAGPSARFCGSVCRCASNKPKIHARGVGPPLCETWPPAVAELTDQLAQLEAGAQVADPARRPEIEGAKQAAMAAEGWQHGWRRAGWSGCGPAHPEPELFLAGLTDPAMQACH